MCNKGNLKYVRWWQMLWRRIKQEKMESTGGEGALIKKVIFDLRPTGGKEAHLADTWGKNIPGKGNHKCKCSGA